jgi:benzoate-CoA ligase
VTGDLVRRDVDGYVTYAGRADDLLKVAGKWMAPQEVESCLLEHPGVIEVAVVGVPDDAGLTKPHAFVVARSPGDGLSQELHVFLQDRLQSYKQPKAIRFLDALPRTHLGKVDRKALQALAR